MPVSALPVINLLPWREARQRRRRVLFFVILGTLLLMVMAIAAGAVLLTKSILSAREQANVAMSSQVAALQHAISEQDAVFDAYQLQGVELAQTTRLHTARLRQIRTFVTLLGMESEGLTLDRLRYEPAAIYAAGSADSARHVSRWMRMLGEHSDVLNTELQMLSIEEDRSQERHVYFYRVKFELKLPDMGLMHREAGS